MGGATNLRSQIVTASSSLIERAILLVRGHKVMLDADLAKLYGVETKVLLQALKRNPDRFPKDFMFQLTDQEFRDLRSQFVTSSWGGRHYAPYAFTEQGAAMLSKTRPCRFKIANCDLRDWAWTAPQIPTQRIHRAPRDHGRHRPQFAARHRSFGVRGACLRAPARNPRDERGACSET